MYTFIIFAKSTALKQSLKTVEGIDKETLHPKMQTLPEMTFFKMPLFLKIPYSFIKKSYAHLQYVDHIIIKFEIDSRKTVAKADHTKLY